MRWIALAGLGILACVGYFAGLARNPPGFALDESSIAYNAWSIATTGRDEHGVVLPLYFRAFGEYKNPMYIYGLAALWRLVPPSIAAARAFSAASGLLAVGLLGLLAFRISRNRLIAIVVSAVAAATPMLFELSHLVYEVALYPLMVVLFLLVVWRAAQEPRWSGATVVLLIVTLTLLTFTYSIGRLFAPLLAGGLLIFASRQRAVGLLITLTGFTILSIVPLAVFQRTHPDFTRRFESLTYLRDARSPAEKTVEFGGRLIRNAGLSMTSRGDPDPRHHVRGGYGSILLGEYVVGIAGTLVVFTRLNRWWSFVLYGTVVSLVPASLTRDDFHTLRLSAFPVFLCLLMIPALESAVASRRRIWRLSIATALIVAMIQAALFQVAFHRNGPKRIADFDVALQILTHRIAARGRPMVVMSSREAFWYVHVFWYGALAGFRSDEMSIASTHAGAPPGAVFVAALPICAECRILDAQGRFVAYEIDP